jgi:tetratricopeptide (TPR) repeat protein
LIKDTNIPNDLELLFFQGKFDKLEDIVEKLPLNEKLNGLMWIARKNRIIGRKKEAEKILEGIVTIAGEYLNSGLYIYAQIERTWILINSHEEKGVIQLKINEIESKLKSDPSSDEKQLLLAHLFNLNGFYQRNTLGDYNQALLSFQASCKIFDDLNRELWYAQSLQWLSGIYTRFRQFNKALEIANNIIAIYTKFKADLGFSSIYNSLGLLYMVMGNFNNSLNAFKKGMEVDQRLGLTFVMWSSYNIGGSYINRGEFEKALKLNLNRIKILEDENLDGGPVFNILPYSGAGDIHKYLGNYDQSLNFYQLALQKWKEVPQTMLTQNYLAMHYLDLIDLHLLEQNLDQAHEIFNEFKMWNQTLEESPDAIRIRNNLLYCEALILKFSPRMVNKSQAQIKFKQLLEEDVIHGAIRKIEIIKHLCDLYIYELKSEPSEEVFNEAKLLIKHLIELASEHGLFLKLIEAYIILSKFELIESNFQKAINTLEKAKNIATEQNLTHLYQTIENEIEALNDKVQEWNSLIERNAELTERIKASKLEDYVRQALKIKELSD